MGVCLALILVASWFNSANLIAQDEEPVGAIDAAAISEIMNDEGEPEAPPADEASGIDLLTLIASGGKFMIPIGIMSLLVVALAVERTVVLRAGKIVPRKLVRDLNELTDPISKFNPSVAYQSCLDYPSPAGRVVGSMLLRTGQPLGEIERTAAEATQREVDRYSAPIRWLNLAAAATPLMGLLGTVWGMIVAFHESTSLSADRSRSEQLSEGIYTALVTTLAGLIVAIPAAILAQYLENRVISLFHRVEQLAFDVAPGLVRFTGKRTLDVDGSLRPMEQSDSVVRSNESPVPPPPPAPPRPGKKKRGGAKAG